MTELNNYNFSENFIAEALHYYTQSSCCGQEDEDFFYEVSLNTFYDKALELCIVLDYLEILYIDYIYAEPLAKNIMGESADGNTSK